MQFAVSLYFAVYLIFACGRGQFDLTKYSLPYIQCAVVDILKSLFTREVRHSIKICVTLSFLFFSAMLSQLPVLCWPIYKMKAIIQFACIVHMVKVFFITGVLYTPLAVVSLYIALLAVLQVTAVQALYFRKVLQRLQPNF